MMLLIRCTHTLSDQRPTCLLNSREQNIIGTKVERQRKVDYVTELAHVT